MVNFDFKKRIRYGETDMMGYLYYGNYGLLYEIGRVEMMRSVGLSYKMLEKEYKVMMPVAYVESRYLKPITYEDEITIRTILKEKPSRLMVFHHELYNSEDILVHTAVVKLFFINMENSKPISCPSYMLEVLNPLF